MRFDDDEAEIFLVESQLVRCLLCGIKVDVFLLFGSFLFFIHTDQKPQKITKGNKKINLPRAKSFHNSPIYLQLKRSSSHNETHTFHHSGLRCRRPRHSKPRHFRHGYENGKCGNAHCTHFYTHCHVCCSSNYG